MGWVGLTSLMDTDTAAARWDYPRLAECKRHRGGGYGNDTVSVVGRREKLTQEFRFPPSWSEQVPPKASSKFLQANRSRSVVDCCQEKGKGIRDDLPPDSKLVSHLHRKSKVSY